MGLFTCRRRADLTPLGPMRRMAPYSTRSSPLDDPDRFGYLHTSLSTPSHSDAVSEVDKAISRELAQSSYDLAFSHIEICAS